MAKNKKELVSYVQELISSDLALPFYNVNRLFELHEITIASILFKEDKNKKLLSVIECSNLNDLDGSVDLIIYEKSWIEYLPEIYKHNSDLKNFLYGMQVTMFKQQMIVNHIEDVFTPRKSEFLDWLASWYGVGFSISVDNNVKRELIHQLLTLYKKRGTREYLIEIVHILLGVKIEIEERKVPKIEDEEFFINEQYNEKISFTVKIIDDSLKSDKEKKMIIQKVRNILVLEKPAFTKYYIDSKLEEKSYKSGIDRPTTISKELKLDKEIVKEEVKEVLLDHHQSDKEDSKKSRTSKDWDDFF